MIFEITRDYTIIVPLMISNLIAYIISYKLQKQPIYEALAAQEGVYLPTAHSRAQADRIQVREAMRPPPPLVSPDLPVAMVLRQMTDSGFDALPVGDTGGLWGMVRISELEQAADEGASHQKVAEILSGNSRSGSSEEDPQHVYPDHSLSLALERMGTTGMNVLPVVSRANVRKLMGVIALADILRAYGVAKQGSAAERCAASTTMRCDHDTDDVIAAAPENHVNARDGSSRSAP